MIFRQPTELKILSLLERTPGEVIDVIDLEDSPMKGVNDNTSKRSRLGRFPKRASQAVRKAKVTGLRQAAASSDTSIKRQSVDSKDDLKAKKVKPVSLVQVAVGDSPGSSDVKPAPLVDGARGHKSSAPILEGPDCVSAESVPDMSDPDSCTLVELEAGYFGEPCLGDETIPGR